MQLVGGAGSADSAIAENGAGELISDGPFALRKCAGCGGGALIDDDNSDEPVSGSPFAP